jgi:hypothetical protein
VVSPTGPRDSTLTNKDLLRMLHRWEVPMPWEAHRVDHLVDDGSTATAGRIR